MATLAGAVILGSIDKYASSGHEYQMHIGAGCALSLQDRDNTPPVIVNVSPAPGTITRTQSISFDVTDNLDALSEVYVLARNVSTSEVVYDGSFRAPYSASSKVAITHGFTFSITRTNGWPSASLTLEVFAIDHDGNIASPTTYAYTISNPDLTAPTFDNFSPAKAGAIASGGNATFDAYDAAGDTPDLGGNVQVYSITPAGARVAVYTSGAFQSGFSGTRNGSNNRSFSIARTGGWQEPVVLELYAFDPNGNVTRDVYVLHLTGSAFLDSTTPSIASLSPSPGTITRSQAVTFDVTDPEGLRPLVIWLVDGAGNRTLIHDDTAFAPAFATNSTRSAISNGYTLSLRRTGGWPSSFTLYAAAIDVHGNEHALSLGTYTVSNADLTGPIFSGFSPAKYDEVLALGTIGFDAYDSGGDQPDLGTAIVITAIESGGRVPVYSSGAFQAPYAGTRNGSDNRHFAISRSGGWVEPVVLELVGTDVAGNQSRDVYVAHVTGSSAADTVAPTIANLVPAAGTTIQPLDPIQFEVTDESGAFTRVMLTVLLNGSGVDEVAYDGAEFRGFYAAASSREIIPNGFRFTLLRAGGWPSTPTIRAFAIDRGGNETLL